MDWEYIAVKIDGKHLHTLKVASGIVLLSDSENSLIR